MIRWPVNEIETLIGYELHKASEQLYTRKFLSSVRFGTISLFNGLTDDLVTHLMASLRTVTFDVGKTVVAMEIWTRVCSLSNLALQKLS